MFIRFLTPVWLLASFLSLTSVAALADSGRTWLQLSPQQQRALAPLAQDWQHFPADQQNKLLLVANRFDTLTPTQQQLLQKRLRTWSRLTPQQRQAARQNLTRIQTLPDADQKKIKERWLDALCKEFPSQKAPDSPTQ